MFYSLAHLEESFHVNNTYKFIALAPCFIANDDIDFDTALETTFKYADYGVYVYAGPNYDKDIETICANFPDYACERFSGYGGCQPTCIKSENHWD